MRVSKALAIAFLLAVEVVEHVLEAGDGSERRDHHGKLNLVVGASALQHRGVAISVMAEALAGIFQIQVEGWDGTLRHFESSLSASLGAKLPASVGETVRHKNFLIIRVAPRRLWLALDEGTQAPPLPSIRISAVRFPSAKVACVSA